jgi:hypothetical protein
MVHDPKGAEYYMDRYTVTGTQRTFRFNNTVITSELSEDLSGWTTVIKTPFNTVTVKSGLVCSCDDVPGGEESWLWHILNVLWPSFGDQKSNVRIDGKLVVNTAELRDLIFASIRERVSIQTSSAILG